MNDRFEAEFQNLMGSRSDSLLALVQWCAHHRMYQQGLTKDKTEANGNALFRVATLTEAQEYLTAAVEQGELLLDLTRKDTVAQGIVYYQSVQQYRNQINHATDSAVKFQKDTGLLPLSTSAIEQTLGDVAFYLFKLKECKATAPVGIELLDSNKAF